MQPTPPFLTNREIDTFLGGGAAGTRHRQRLHQDGVLPEAKNLGRVQQFNLLIYPRFALAALLDEFRELPKAERTIAMLHRRAFRSSAFREVSNALRMAAGELGAWRFDELVERTGLFAEDALMTWNEVVEEAESHLHERFNIGFSSDLGIVQDLRPGICVVSFEDGAERFPRNRLAAPLEKGHAVAVERVKVMGSEQDFLMPSMTQVDEEERELIAWFAERSEPAAGAPTAVIFDETDNADRLPYRRPAGARKRRVRVAGTMNRAATTVH